MSALSHINEIELLRQRAERLEVVVEELRNPVGLRMQAAPIQETWDLIDQQQFRSVVHHLAADLLELHDASAISLDNWEAARTFVERLIGAEIKENRI
jgi:hypothetical protein